MKSVDLISKGIETIYSGDDCRVKHIGLFALTGIMSLITLNLKAVAEASKNSQITPNFAEITVAILVFLLISVYIGGYNLQFMHNVHHDEELPDLDGKPILAVLKSIPLAVVWIIYFSLIIMLLCLLFSGTPGYGGILYALFASLPIFFIFVPYCYTFVWTAFSKDFDAKGLFNPLGAFKYLKAFGILSAVFLCLVVLNIIIYIPIGIVGGLIGVLGGGDKTASFVGGILGGYLGYVVQLVLAYCLVQIYKERFEQQEY